MYMYIYSFTYITLVKYSLYVHSAQTMAKRV